MKSRDRNTTGTPEQCTIANSLDSLDMDEFQEFMRGYVLRASSASTSHANRAAVIIAEKMGEVKFLDNTRQNSKLNAMRKFVQKDKWMMCAQVILWLSLCSRGKTKRWKKHLKYACYALCVDLLRFSLQIAVVQFTN